jgi:NhaP-type Na+/H+ or K+/H+ antiporter
MGAYVAGAAAKIKGPAAKLAQARAIGNSGVRNGMEQAMATGAEAGLAPVAAFALVGALGVGAQWLAWRLKLPAIVLMLLAGLIVGPVTGLFIPARDLGDLVRPMVSVAVAIILFEGGLSLTFQGLADAAKGVRRLVIIGAPLGWLGSALALRYLAGLDWASAAVFGGIMIVTGPTVIAPLLRQARLPRRPAALLQWEAIVNDPIGALAAVLAFQVVVVTQAGAANGLGPALAEVGFGTVLAGLIGAAAGRGIAVAFRRAMVPEYMKVPVLFASVLGAFALSDLILHESGLLAVTVMGLVLANAQLPSYSEMRRFKEHATILLVSGVFILLAAGLDPASLAVLDWRAAVFVVGVILVVRPLTVALSLIGSGAPWREVALVAFTGPRGVVLVAVAGLFGERLSELGIAGGAALVPLAFALVAATVVLHGFTLVPLARALGLTGAEAPGVIVVGGSAFPTALAAALDKAGLPVLVADPNYVRLRRAREAGLPVFYGDILSEAAEHRVEMVRYATVIAATANDAYNTLVATDLASEFGREHVFQVNREKDSRARHALPPGLGGQSLRTEATLADLDQRIAAGDRVVMAKLEGGHDLAAWRRTRPNAVILARITREGARFLPVEAELDDGLSEGRLIALVPKGEGREATGDAPTDQVRAGDADEADAAPT